MPKFKILRSEQELIEWRANHERRGIVVVTNGCFDILHAQHVHHLEQARRRGLFLLVGMDSDERVRALKGSDRPVNSEDDRAAVLAGLDAVTAVYIFNTSSAEFLRLARPHIWVKGGDYTLEKLQPEERAVIKELHAEILILPLLEGDSTSSIVKRIKLSGNSVVLPVEHAGVYLHGGPDCECQTPQPYVAPPAREATDEDRAMLNLPQRVVSAPTLEELNPCQPDGAPVANPVSLFDQLFNLVQNAPCPNYGPQMRYPGGLSANWAPCGRCAVCKLKEDALALRSNGA